MTTAQHHQAASLSALDMLWHTVENSPVPKALTDPLPFELPPGAHNGGADDSDSDEDEPGLWYRGMEWLEQLARTRATQRHLAKYSPQGDMLFPEEYIVRLMEKEEREWREWNQHTQGGRASAMSHVAAAGGGGGGNVRGVMGDVDDDDLVDDDDYPSSYGAHSHLQPSTSSMRHQQPQYSYAAAVASAANHSDAMQRIEDVGALTTSSHANQDVVMYDESGQAFDVYGPAFDAYHPEASQFDPRSGLMTTPPVLAHPGQGGGLVSSSSPSAATSSSEPSFVPPGSHAQAGVSFPDPSPSPSLSAFQSYEGFGGHNYSADRL
jgi:hypothetical protein